MKAKILLLAGILVLALSTVGCNLFGFMSKPGNDEQYLSVARGCFDSGDFTCALENYQKLSSTYDDIRLSETAFITLAQNGMTMGVFMEAFGNGEGASGIRIVANHLASTASRTVRLAIFGAYAAVDGSTANGEITDANLKGFVKFVVALSLAAEILAEDAAVAGSATEFTTEDFALTPASCKTLGAGCAGGGACAKPTGAKMTSTLAAFDLDTATAGTSTAMLAATLPDLQMFNAAIVEVDAGLTAVQAGGKFGTGTGGFATQMINAAGQIGTADGACYRQVLLNQGL